MIIDNYILDDLTAKAKESPRLRMNLDLRTTPEDQSQRMLNAVEPGTEVPIHRHQNTSETVVCVRGHIRELYFDESGALTESIDVLPGGVVVNIPAGQWHTIEVLESGTVIFEAKDGAYAPLKDEDILKL